MKYLNPKADLTFKKVFGEHTDLIISFLNALLPFDKPEEEITEVEYLNSVRVPPPNLFWNDNVLNVRCKNQQNQVFYVELQIIWTVDYRMRMSSDESTVCINKSEIGNNHKCSYPVYSLNLVNDTFSQSDNCYHDFQIVEVAETSEVIEGLRFIFVELPKFSPKNFRDKKMAVLWLRYLTEINEKTRMVPQELLDNPEIRKAVDQLEVSAFTEAQLLGYDKFWDIISTAKMNISSTRREAREKGLQEGLQKGLQEGLQEGLQKGLQEGLAKGLVKGQADERLKIARNLKQLGMTAEVISQATGLTQEEIDALPD